MGGKGIFLHRVYINVTFFFCFILPYVFLLNFKRAKSRVSQHLKFIKFSNPRDTSLMKHNNNNDLPCSPESSGGYHLRARFNNNSGGWRRRRVKIEFSSSPGVHLHKFSARTTHFLGPALPNYSRRHWQPQRHPHTHSPLIKKITIIPGVRLLFNLLSWVWLGKKSAR